MNEPALATRPARLPALEWPWISIITIKWTDAMCKRWSCLYLRVHMYNDFIFFFVILSIKQKITTQKADNARTFKTDYQIHVYIHFRCVIIFCALSNNFELIYSSGLTNSLYSPFFASIFIHYILKMQINGKFISKIWIS